MERHFLATARIRGIYSTALAKLLLDQGFTIVQASQALKERFSLKESDESPDLDINNRRDLQGIRVLGKSEVVNTFLSLLSSRLEDVIVRKWSLTTGGIYPGVTKEIEAPALILEGAVSVDVEFPAQSKHILDTVRKEVVPTIDGHHYYKACGQRVSAMLGMAEKMLEKGASHADVDELFRQTVELEYPSAGAWVRIEHVKLSGKVLNLGPALLEAYNSETHALRLHRVFKREGIYDGLAVRKEPDDYAVTQLRLGDWHFKTQYFSKNDQLKGTYINLNTPIELYPFGLRYVDLEADICLWPDGRFEILDHEKLEDSLRNGVVTEKLVETVKAKLSELVESIRSDLASKS
jgi:hypothetical protein